jgi:SAM-dependent methyltransferase
MKLDSNRPSWDSSWEKVFRSRDWGKYPPEELVRFVAQTYYSAPDRKLIRLLEVGCGTGANVWFMAREGFDVCGIDGSITAIEKARQRLKGERVQAQLELGDVADLQKTFPEMPPFDGVIDVCCLQHNSIENAERIIGQMWALLKTGGKLFSMLVAEGSYGSAMGKHVDSQTRIDIAEGPFKDVGLVHFFTISEIRRLFAAFADLQIEYSVRSYNEMHDLYKHWVVTGTKL